MRYFQKHIDITELLTIKKTNDYYNDYKYEKAILNDNTLLLDNIVWKISSIGDIKTGENIIDTNIRNSFYSEDYIRIKYSDFVYNNVIRDILDIDIDCNLELKYNNTGYYLEWKMLKYEKNGFFKKHKDGKKNDLHFATALLLPPKVINSYQGGELVLYDNNNETIITPDEKEWKLVVFGLDVEHELKEVLEGTRYVLKTELEFDYSTKLLFESKTYNEKIDIAQIDNTEDKSKTLEELEFKMNTLQNKLDKLKLMYSNIENNIYDNYDYLNDFYQKIKKEIDRNIYISNGFIVPLFNYYEYPELHKLKLVDMILYNGIFDNFKVKNIKIFNVKSKINMGDGQYTNDIDNHFGSNISLNCIIEDYETQDQSEYCDKFADISIFYAGDYYHNKIPGKLNGCYNQYNDATYDNIELIDITYLYVVLRNNGRN